MTAFLVTISAFSAAQGERVDYTASVDWQSQVIEIETVVVSPARTGVRTTLEAEREAAHSLPNRTVTSVYNVQLDSLATVGERLEEEPHIGAELLEAVSAPELEQRYPSADLRSVVLEHRLPLYPTVISPFIEHTRPRQPPRHIGWVPTRDFTGIVIYAAEPLPVHGTNRSTYVEPALLPEVFDNSDSMRSIITPKMLDPDMLRRWGVAAYTASPDEAPHVDRIGPTPLRLRATGAFGSTPTDLIIHEEDANMILASPANRRLIEEGRILIILNDSVTTGPLTSN
ncbi:MAG: hypothetical protein ACOCYC_03100 [bacterium]